MQKGSVRRELRALESSPTLLVDKTSEVRYFWGLASTYPPLVVAFQSAFQENGERWPWSFAVKGGNSLASRQ
jgi:hypothetical protein